MTDLARWARQGWQRVSRAGAYVLMPKFTSGAIVAARDDSPDDDGAVNPRVLLVRKRTGGGEWGFPAGYVGYGSSIVQTAAKELAQETGLRPPIDVTGHLRTYRQPWAMHLDHLFLVAATGEPRTRDEVEIAEARWWPIGSLPPLGAEARLALAEVPDLLTRPIPAMAPSPASARAALFEG